MKFSKWLLIVLCVASGLGGAALVGIICSISNDRIVVTDKINQSHAADKQFNERPNSRGGAKGY